MGSDSSQKNKIVIIGVSSILLVAAVVGTVTYGISRNNKNDVSQVSTASSNKAVQTVCAVTDYKEACQKSLANATDNMDIKQLIQVALKASIESVQGVINSSPALSEAAKNPSVTEAFRVCNESLDLSIYTLEKSIDRINGSVDKDNFQDFMDDLKTWLSGTVSFQEACMDAFDNSTGETGEKVKELMKTTRELSSNGLAMISELSHLISGIDIPTTTSAQRKLLENGERRMMYDDYYPPDSEPKKRSLLGENGERRMMYDDYYPPDAEKPGRRLLQNDDLVDHSYVDQPHIQRLLLAKPQALRPNAVVALDGSGQFKSIQAAINTAPSKVNRTFVIHVKAGVYHEYVQVPKYVYNILLVGDGPLRTRITGSKNNVDGVGTWNTATFAVNGDNFIARDIAFENSAGAIKHQAVALRVSADKAVFFNCHLDGYQDTVYNTAGRQFFRDCQITGTVDFIFGDASVVFQNCKMIVRKPMAHQACMVTAQGRADKRSNGGTVLHNCDIVPAADYFSLKPAAKAYLGRPWKQYSRTLIMQSNIDGFIQPEGWAPWEGNFALNTLQYGEYLNRGAGANISGRVKWKGIQHITPAIADSFTVRTFLTSRTWLMATGIPYEAGLMRH